MIEIQVLADSGIEIPRYATPGSAAFDLQANIAETVVLKPGEFRKLPTGIKVWICDPSIVGLIVPRSGMGCKGLAIKNVTGVIDSDYQGEIIATVWNTNSVIDGEDVVIEPFQKVMQMLIVPVVTAKFKLVTEFSDSTSRGEGGFGSTDAGKVDQAENVAQLDWISHECC